MEFNWELAGKPVSAEDIRAFEVRHEAELPEDYRRFLLSSNGGMPSIEVCHSRSGYDVALCQMYALNDEHPYHLDRMCKSLNWEEAYSLGYLCIGRDPGGSEIFVSTHGDDRGSVYFFDREELIRPPESPIKLADSFTKFLAELEAY